jgi:pimeloyl-ACP methyl ester carboxylesterase
MPEQFCDVGRGITLCYETFGDPSDPTALLIMGLATQMVAWQEDFCLELASRGLHVVRFDNRDVGRSTHLQGPPPTIGQLLIRSRRAARYTLADMADDAAGLLSELELAPAHVIGASMGGMIAQTLAARHPQSVRSLVSIMSNTGRLWSGQPMFRIYPVFLRRAPQGRDAFIAHIERLFMAIGSTGLPRDPDDLRAIAEAHFDRDHDPAGPGRQLAAIIASGDRTAELRRITAPTLVIHGTADPLVRHSGGRATARAIHGAKLMSIEGMGHDLPRAVWPRLIDAIAEHATRADGLQRATHRCRPFGRSLRTLPSSPSARGGRVPPDPRPPPASCSPGPLLNRRGVAGDRPAGPPPCAPARWGTSACSAVRAPASAGRDGSASAGTASGREARGASVAPGKRTVSSTPPAPFFGLASCLTSDPQPRPLHRCLPLMPPGSNGSEWAGASSRCSI